MAELRFLSAEEALAMEGTAAAIPPGSAVDLSATVAHLHARVDAEVSLRRAAVGAALRFAASAADLRDIIEGRELPPTPAEAAAHAAAGGLWLLRMADTDGVPFSFVTAVPGRCTRLIRAWSLDSDGRPCAWPIVAEVPRG